MDETVYIKPGDKRLMVHLAMQDEERSEADGPDPFDDFGQFQHQRYLQNLARNAPHRAAGC